MHISTYYGQWKYWQLFHKVTFDGPNKLILINDGVTELDVQTDIYSDWKEWLLLEDNTKYLQAISTVGGEPTIAGQFLDVTYFLINGWKLKPYPGSYDLNIIGNIFDLDGGSIKVSADNDPLFANNINVNTNTSVIVRQIAPEVTISGSGLTDAESALLYDISGSIVEVKSILSSPLTASLVPAQETALYDIQTKATTQEAILSTLQTKIDELWKIHGLDSGSALTVRRTERLVGSISQSISTTGSGSTQETILTRTS